ncbi:MAG: PAS domain S-box protein, partial [Bdellovibrionales bacterium]|nr:PAS domain S-box protein [Bdellovibrionales bacterium]
MTSVFDKIFESSPIAQIAIDENSKIKIANKQAEKLFGYNKSELVEKNIDLLVPLESKQRHPKLVKAFFESPIPRIMGQGRNLFGLKKNGVLFPIEIGLAPVETDTGLWVVSSIIDLSKQYYAEERFRSAVESAPNGMLMIDSNGSIVMVNKQIEKLFEYDRNELLDMAIEILVPDEFKQHHPRFIESYIKNPIPRAMGIGRELYGRTKGGRLFPVEIGLQPLKERENSIYVLASVVDISTRRKAEKELEEKSEELQEFAYRTSHDLKSPLTTLTSIIKCVEEDLVENDINEATSNLNKAYSIAKNLQSLVQTLLFLTKAELDSENSSPFKFDQFLENFLLNHQS